MNSHSQIDWYETCSHRHSVLQQFYSLHTINLTFYYQFNSAHSGVERLGEVLEIKYLFLWLVWKLFKVSMGIKHRLETHQYNPRYIQTNTQIDLQQMLTKLARRIINPVLTFRLPAISHWWQFHRKLRLKMFIKCSVRHSNPPQVNAERYVLIWVNYCHTVVCYWHTVGFITSPQVVFFQKLVKFFREGQHRESYIYQPALSWI